MSSASLRVFDPATGAGYTGELDDLLDPGDVAACYGTDLVSRVITFSPTTASIFSPRLSPSHVALICQNTTRLPAGETLWCESTTLCPHRCLLRGRRVAGYQVHRPEDRIADYTEKGGRVDIYRLVPLDQLAIEERDLLSEIMLKKIGNYDSPVTYDWGGALVSGTRVLRLLGLLGADKESLFCSELVAGVLQRMGRMRRRLPARYNPGRLLRRLRRDGVYRFEFSIGPGIAAEAAA